MARTTGMIRAATPAAINDNENPGCNQIDDLMETVETYRAWESHHAAALRQREDAVQSAKAAAEAARFAKAEDAIIRGLKRWRRDGLSLQEAANKLPVGYGNCWGYTYDDLLAVLRKLGIKRGPQNSVGGRPA